MYRISWTYTGIILIALLQPWSLFAQIGGGHTYDFLNLTYSARLVGIGGENISTFDDDVSLALNNPSLLNDSMHKHAAISFSTYLAGIKYGYASYSHTLKKIGSFHAGVQYVNYGTLQGADEFGNLTQTFSANDLVIIVGGARELKRRVRLGANMKYISSNPATGFGYNSSGLAWDIGAHYRSKNELFSAGISIQNLGLQLTTYTGTPEKEPLPFEITMGVSNKLKYMPLRFSVTFVHLQKPQLIFEDPDKPKELDLNGEVIQARNQWVDNLFRHTVFGGEFLLGPALRLRFGYNHLRARELRAENRSGFTGFSLGLGFRVKRLAFDYGYSSYGISSLFQAHQFGLLLNLAKE